MADTFEVTAHSVTVQCRGLTHEGQESDGRHWLAGSIIELGKADAEVLLKAGAVKSTAAALATAEKVQKAVEKLSAPEASAQKAALK